MHDFSHVLPLIMAGGLGTRMKSKGAKSMSLLAGRPLIAWIIDLCEALNTNDIIVVTNPAASDLNDYLAGADTKIKIHNVVQAQALGTANAVASALNRMRTLPQSHVLILSGDVPNLRKESVISLIRTARDGIGLMTAKLRDAAAYGRIIRQANGQVQAIVEAKDCSAEELLINEINTGMYLVPKEMLLEIIPRIGNNNKAGEYYLTDLIALARESGVRVYPEILKDWREGAGINTQDELARAEDFRLELMNV